MRDGKPTDWRTAVQYGILQSGESMLMLILMARKECSDEVTSRQRSAFFRLSPQLNGRHIMQTRVGVRRKPPQASWRRRQKGSSRK